MKRFWTTFRFPNLKIEQTYTVDDTLSYSVEINEINWKTRYITSSGNSWNGYFKNGAIIF